MKAVIMAGGEGSRLRPLTCDRPKPLVPVGNRPVMAYSLDLLAQHGFQEVFVTLGYRPSAVPNYFSEAYKSMRLHYVVEETPLGTAGSVAALREHLDGTFLVISGDALTDIDLGALLAFHRSRGAVATLAMKRVSNPLEYGVIMADSQGRIRRFLEKPGWGEVFSDTVNTGIYVLEPEVLRGVPEGRSHDFSQHLFPALLQMEAPLYAAMADGYWCDIGDPVAYLQANLDLVAGKLRFWPAGEEIVPGVWVNGPVPAGVTVDGPALIGEGCRLAPGTRLEAGAVLGPATVTGPNAVVRRSVTWSGVRLGPGTTLVGAIVCEGAVLESGAGAFEGAVIGSNCSAGERAVISPGVRLWPRTEVAPGARVDVTLVQAPVWSGRLLHAGSMTGRLGADLFPETALRVGTAFASLLRGTGPIVVGGDAGAATELLRQALVCGAMAAGRKVIDVGVTASPVTEFAMVRRGAAGGLHVRAHGGLSRVIFYEAGGRPASRDLQRKLEQACMRQDFPRAMPEGAGTTEWFRQAEQCYLDHLNQQIARDRIRARRFPVELDGQCWPLLPQWLASLQCQLVDTGGALRVKINPMEATWELAGASSDAMLALELWLGIHASSEKPEVRIPVTASTGVEVMLERAGRRPVRVRQADWLPGDPLLAIGRLLERMAVEGLSQADIINRLPTSCTAIRMVACPWEAKGRIMRQLMEEHADRPHDLIDGLRIRQDEGWALLLPDPDEPVYRIYAEAGDLATADALAERYVRRVLELLEQ